MKTKLLKACSLLLAISMLIIPASIVSGAEGISDVEAVGTSVALDGSKDVEVKVAIAFTADVNCYGIEGIWDKESSDNSAIELTKIEISPKAHFTVNDDFIALSSGKVMWDDDSFDYNCVFEEDSNLLTATYKVPADTAPGVYKVRFLCEVYTDASGFPVEFENTYLEATITVTCNRPPVLQPGQASDCDTDGWKDYYKCEACGKYYTDADRSSEITDLDAWKEGEGNVEAGHVWNDEPDYYEDKKDGKQHIVYYACSRNCGQHKAETVDHEYVNGTCVCDAVEPVTGLKGDVNSDGWIDMEDFTLIARHVSEVELLTDESALYNADINNDDLVDMEDFTLIARHVSEVELITNSNNE